ncbi:MAG: dehydrogenase [Candidatus Saccharibacteria bacterium]|nr:dehydrogenase [Candidatus Saccharibacteria bacterium]
MKTGIFYGPGDIRVETRPDPTIQEPTDVVVKVTYSCICGSDLWAWRAINKRETGGPVGHEFMGIVEAVGDTVTKFKVGDLVIAPFSISDGTCPECRNGMTSACRHGSNWGRDDNDGGQASMVRVPMAEGTLTAVPDHDKLNEQVMRALLPLSDVLCTGHHVAVSAEVGPGKTVAVIGDGAVGLCAVAASKRLGATKIILISTHPDRAEIGQQFGATDIVDARGDDAVKQIKALTDDAGVDAMLECVGTDESWETSFAMTRAGGIIGFVGAPHAKDPSLMRMFRANIGIRGGVAPAGAYIPELLPDVLSGKLDVSPIFTLTIPLDDLAEGYQAMDERRAIKTLIKL